MLCFFFYSFTASDGSEESTAGRVASPCSIKMHYGYRSNEARRARKHEYRLRQTTSHCRLPAMVMYPANSTKRFSRFTRSTSILLMKDVQIYIYIRSDISITCVFFQQLPLCCISSLTYYFSRIVPAHVHHCGQYSTI